MERQCRFLACGLRDDIDDAADGISAVLRARRPANDLDAFDILRAEPHHFVACAAILRHITENRMSVHHDQRMPRLRAADRHADIPHRIDRARHADLAEDNVLDRLGLLLLNVLPGDNRRALTFVLGLFLGRVDLNDNVSRFDPIVPPPADYPPRRRAGSAR